MTSGTMIEILAKQCRQCRVVIGTGDLVRSRAMRGGVDRICKPCNVAHARRWALANTEKMRAHQRNRRNKPGQRDREAAQRREARADDPSRFADYQRAHRTNRPDAYRARTAVNNAIRDGRLTRLPCEVCGSTTDVHGHHDDYSRPLDVRWLCSAHHAEVHHAD